MVCKNVWKDVGATRLEKDSGVELEGEIVPTAVFADGPTRVVDSDRMTELVY